MQPPHSARVVNVRKGTLHLLATPTHQPSSVSAAHPPPIPIHRSLRLGLPLPAPTAPLRLRYIRTNASPLHSHHRRVAVIPLVADHRTNLGRLHFRRRQPRLGLFQGPSQRLRIALVRAVKLHPRYRSALQIHRVLHLVRHPRPTVLRPRYPRVRVRPMLPIPVRGPLLPLPVQTLQIRCARVRDPRLLSQPTQILPIPLPVSRRTIPRIDAFANSIVPSTPNAFPRNSPAFSNRPRTQPNTSPCASAEIRTRVFDSVEWSGHRSINPNPRNRRRLSESERRHAICRSESHPSKYPTSSSRK